MFLRLIQLIAFLIPLQFANAKDDFVCPEVTSKSSVTRSGILQESCLLGYEGKVIQHGPFRAWWPDGNPMVSGEMTFGKRTGMWVTWHPNGIKRYKLVISLAYLIAK